MKNYIYPDNNDSLTCLFISSKSDEKYWADSEKNILNKIIERIKILPSAPKLLDLGCGLGRLFSTFIPYVSSITGIEPDYGRFSGAQQEANKIDSNKIKVINNFVDSVTNEKYDAVLISHIFQHIPFETTQNTFNILKNIIPSGGLLFITTTFTNTPNDIFTLEYLKNGKHFSEPVSESDFVNRFNEEGVLPVRELSYNTMQKLFTQNGFALENMYGYHYKLSSMNEIPTVEFDEKMNSEKNYSTAKDVLYILRRL